MRTGDRIKKIRLEKHMTQKQLAEKIGFSPVNISQLENRDREPNMATLRKIAEALNVDVSELVGEEVQGDIPILSHDWANDVATFIAGNFDKKIQEHLKTLDETKQLNHAIIDLLNINGDFLAFGYLSELIKNPWNLNQAAIEKKPRTTSEQREKEE